MYCTVYALIEHAIVHDMQASNMEYYYIYYCITIWNNMQVVWY